MSVSPLATDVGLLLGGTAAVCSCDVLFLLSLGLHLSFVLLRAAFRAASECNALHDDGIDVVSSVIHIIEH